MPSGKYDVQIEHPGFKPSVSRVRVGNQPPRPINVALVLADVRQEVTVGAEATQVSTNASDNLDTVTMDRSALDDLPIFDQDFIGTMSRFLDASSVGTNGVTLIVDGVEGSRAGVSASAIQEVKINQDPYSAEYSRPGRGRIEIITKLGSALFPGPLAVGPTNVVRLDPGVKIPYTLQYSTSAKRQLGKSTTLTLNYTGIRGVHLFRSRDLNAPPPALYVARPDPNLSVLRQIESAGDLEAHSLEIELRGNVTRYFTGMVQYTLGRAYNKIGGSTTNGNRSTAGINNCPANNYDLSGEWARADFDQRNRFSLLGTVTPGRYFKLGVSLSLYSGQPYSETKGRDDNNDGLANDRPLGVPRNSLQGPGYADLDLRWSRDFFLAAAKKDKGPTVALGFDAFNVLNRVNYVSYVGDLSSPFFGKPIAAQPPRRVQISFRFRF